jgi:hypothetical protein
VPNIVIVGNESKVLFYSSTVGILQTKDLFNIDSYQLPDAIPVLGKQCFERLVRRVAQSGQNIERKASVSY